MPQELSSSLVPDAIRSKGLECHFHSELQVEGVPHLPLTATTEQTQEAVAAPKNQLRPKGPVHFGSGGVRNGAGRRGLRTLAFLECQFQQAAWTPPSQGAASQQRRPAVATAH